MNLSYIAGLFDGEGNPYIKKRENKSPLICISITNTNKRVLMEIKRFLKYGHINSQRYMSKRMVFRYRISHRVDAQYFLKSIIPHLIIKREKCEEGLKIIQSYDYKINCVRDISSNMIRNYHKWFTIREIAKLLNISIGSVHKKLNLSK